MFDKYKKGQLAVLKAQIRANEKGFLVSFPTIEARYDMLLDDGKRIYKTQVKYVGYVDSRTNGSVMLDLRKETRGNGRSRIYTKKEIDVVLAYVPQVDKVLWIKDFEGRQTMSFRFEQPKNKQKSRIRMIDDYVW